MASQAKATPEAKPHAPSTSIPGLIGEWIRQGAEGLIATQKILLDLAAQQNALALTLVRERMGFSVPAPSKAFTDLVGKGVHNFFEAQKVLLDIAARQNAIITEGLRPTLADTPLEAFAEVVHQGVDNFVGAHKQFLDVFAKQTEGALEDAQGGKGFDVGRLAELAREGTRDFLVAQRKFLEAVEHQLETKKKGKTAEPAGKTDLFDIAEQSVDALVEAQKRLLDLAASQVDVNVKIVREVFNFDLRSKPATTVTDLMKKSVDSFVAAQKALVELASKPREEQPEEEPELVGAKG